MVGIGVLNGAKVTVCGIQSINLNTEAAEILGIHFPYKKNLKEEKKIHNVVTNVQRVIAMEIEKSYP